MYLKSLSKKKKKKSLSILSAMFSFFFFFSPIQVEFKFTFLLLVEALKLSLFAGCLWVSSGDVMAKREHACPLNTVGGKLLMKHVG